MLKEVSLMVFLCSHATSLIELFIHLILNPRIVLERKCFVLTLTFFPSTCGFEGQTFSRNCIIIRTNNFF